MEGVVQKQPEPLTSSADTAYLHPRPCFSISLYNKVESPRSGKEKAEEEPGEEEEEGNKEEEEAVEEEEEGEEEEGEEAAEDHDSPAHRRHHPFLLTPQVGTFAHMQHVDDDDEDEGVNDDSSCSSLRLDRGARAEEDRAAYLPNSNTTPGAMQANEKVFDGGVMPEANGKDPNPSGQTEGPKWQKPRLTRKSLMKCCLVKWIIASTTQQGPVETTMTSRKRDLLPETTSFTHG
ncbi:unnamed protein product [Pleuronectes platessa]|uniref:Uncharacterized protein n=1 Tax=Pleuronectes platessa TaxID=8262 RepID=A0A9N7Z1H0_PLEPL|nr:unnamed protein product [Pleuronectes platessa]